MRDDDNAIRTGLKGVSVDRVRACQIMLTVNAVRTPQLLSLNNCHGPLRVSDIGSDWTKQLQKSAAIESSIVEFVLSEKAAGRAGLLHRDHNI